MTGEDAELAHGANAGPPPEGDPGSLVSFAQVADPRAVTTTTARSTISARNLTVRRGGAMLVEGVSFGCSAPRVALVGEASFLPRLLLGEAEQSSGELALLGAPAAQALGAGARLVPRDGLLLDDEPVLEGMRLVAELFGVPKSARVAEAVLARLGLSQFGSARPKGLEPAEQRAVSIGIALSTAPQLLIVEQPLDGLDDLRAAWLAERLREVCEPRTGEAPVRLIWTSERLSTSAHRELASAGDLVWLRYGKLLAAGPAAQIFAGDSVCLVRVSGDGKRLSAALAERGVTFEPLGASDEPSNTSTWRILGSARKALVAAAVSTETPVLELFLVQPLDR